MKTKNLKTIDIIALEYFDKINGNSYFAGEIILNYGLKDQLIIILKYQYGYGNQYEYTALKEIQKLTPIAKSYFSITRFCNDYNIVLRSTINSAKKSDLTRFK